MKRLKYTVIGTTEYSDYASDATISKWMWGLNLTSRKKLNRLPSEIQHIVFATKTYLGIGANADYEIVFHQEPMTDEEFYERVVSLGPGVQIFAVHRE